MMSGEDIVMDGVDGVVMGRADGGGVVHVLAGDAELLVMAGGMVGIGGIWWVDDDGGQLLVVCAEQKVGGWVCCQGCKVGPLSGR